MLFHIINKDSGKTHMIIIFVDRLIRLWLNRLFTRKILIIKLIAIREKKTVHNFDDKLTIPPYNRFALIHSAESGLFSSSTSLFTS